MERSENKETFFLIRSLKWYKVVWAELSVREREGNDDFFFSLFFRWHRYASGNIEYGGVPYQHVFSFSSMPKFCPVMQMMIRKRSTGRSYFTHCLHHNLILTKVFLCNNAYCSLRKLWLPFSLGKNIQMSGKYNVTPKRQNKTCDLVDRYRSLLTFPAVGITT